MWRTRRPAGPLRDHVVQLWADDGARDADGTWTIERVLPSGAAHVAVRLDGDPVVLREADGRARSLDRVVVGGVRTEFYVREVPPPAPAVGVQLRPGAAAAVLGVPDGELAGRHVPLDALWGAAVGELTGRLLEAPSADARLGLLEEALVRRLRPAHAVGPTVSHALADLTRRCSVREAVHASGCSHRRFTRVFRDGVGVGPKHYLRLRRFARALRELAGDPQRPVVEVALETGYADQPHLQREFRAFAGLTPGQFRRRAPAHAHHVPETPA